jgi:putative transposase
MMHVFLVKKVRQKMKRAPIPSTACLDSQSVKTTAYGGAHRGFDAGKQIKGEKRFILTTRKAYC